MKKILDPAVPVNAFIDPTRIDMSGDPNICHVLWYDSQILFYPITACLDKELSISEKSLECNADTKYVRQTVFRKRKLYGELCRDGKVVGVTFQGFIFNILKVLAQNHIRVKLQDLRVTKYGPDFPAPRFDLMYGFRYSQRPLLEEFLSKNQSGLVGAPCRFGKTSLIINTLRAFPTCNTVITAPGVDLVKQLYDDVTGERGIRGREVKLICSGSRTKFQSHESDGITICSADSLNKCDPGMVDLLLADEPHSLVTQTRLSLVDMFPRARRYGYGATLKGRFDGRDKLITGVFGPVLVERTYKEAVEEGAICPLNLIFIKVAITPANYGSRDAAYASLLFRSTEMANTVKRICMEVIPDEWQTLIFIKNEVQAELYLDTIGHEHTIAMAKRLTKTEREEINQRMKNNEIKRCLCSDIYVQGVTFSDARVLINAEAGGNNTTAIQKPGRLAEIRPGKKCGIIIDFEFVLASPYTERDYAGEPFMSLISDSKNRLAAYEEMGYGIYRAETIEEAKEIFNSLV